MIRRRRPIQRSRKPIKRSPLDRTKRKRCRAANPFKPSYTTQRKKRRALYKVNRPAARAECYERDGGRCRCPCARPLRLVTDNPFSLYHANEMLPRSLGGSPTDPTNILGMAPECHQQFTDGALHLEPADAALGANGVVYITGLLASGRHVVAYESRPRRRVV